MVHLEAKLLRIAVEANAHLICTGTRQQVQADFKDAGRCFDLATNPVFDRHGIERFDLGELYAWLASVDEFTCDAGKLRECRTGAGDKELCCVANFRRRLPSVASWLDSDRSATDGREIRRAKEIPWEEGLRNVGRVEIELGYCHVFGADNGMNCVHPQKGVTTCGGDG